MSSSRQVTMKDLVEEAKKRIVFLVICVVGLSYLMSLTSSSVWVNLPAAASLIIILRYFSLDFEMRKKAATYNSKQPVSGVSSQKKSIEGQKEIKERSNWRRKVDSPVVEDAIEHFTRHLISEWVTDLWYSRLTPDKEGPEELVHIMNGVIAELSDRAKNINLIDLLTRDLVCLICTHLEIFRMTQAKIPKKQTDPLDIRYLDMELKRILANENKLHPALFSAEAEHKVLQYIMDGFISLAFKAEDLQCSFFRYLVRELLACAVMRPVVNLANPRFINERIEAIVIARTRNKGTVSAEEASPSKNVPTRLPPDHFSRSSDPSVTGVELVQLKTNPSKAASGTPATNDMKGTLLSKDPLLAMEAQSSRSWKPLPSSTQNGNEIGIQRHRSGGEWGEMLDVISRRKAEALAPEHFENMWAKGRNYRRKVGEDRAADQIPPSSSERKSVGADKSSMLPKPKQNIGVGKNNLIGGGVHNKVSAIENSSVPVDQKLSSRLLAPGTQENDENNVMRLEEVDSGSSSYTSEDDEDDTATGLDSPGTKVWDGRSKRNLSVPAIHHPLETFEGHTARKTSDGRIHSQGFHSSRSGRKRGRLSSRKVHVWQEVERTSFLSGDGQDILGNLKDYETDEASSDDFEDELLVRANSGATASSSAPSVSTIKSSANSLQSSPVMDSFLKLRCEVLGANIVKSGSRAFAVYSISVADINNNSWTIKRRFRHFEELHRRLKEFPEYNLHLPPKHFLSTGLDVSVIRERCTLLDEYLKKLMQLPTVSGSIEVWDFLSVDSQTYYFSNSFSIIETLSGKQQLLFLRDTVSSHLMFCGLAVDLGNKPSEKDRRTSSSFAPEVSSNWPETSAPKKKETAPQTLDVPVDGLRVTAKGKRTVNDNGNAGTEETSGAAPDASSDPTLPMEWIPPNLSVPLLDLVDVIFQLQDGGWIRRKAFWVAKQVLQLGMGDAFDDWLIEKIQLLRKGSVVASGIKRVEQILWPDGIFITKHPKRQKSSPPANLSQGSPKTFRPSEPCPPKPSDEQQQEAERRAKFVYELMIDKAPAAIVGLVGRREYEQCAKDLYLFLQSSVCLKLLAYDLLELLLLSAFPELDDTFKQLYKGKDKFGEYKAN